MNRFYSYIAPIAFLVFYFAFVPKLFEEIGDYVGIVFVTIGCGVPLIWLNRVAKHFDNKVLSVLTIIAMVILVGWIIFALMLISAWSSG